MLTIPTLTIENHVTEPAEQMSRLFLYFLAADSSQSNTFYGSISSLKYILKMYTAASDVTREIGSVLTKLYDKFFDTVTVDVAYSEVGATINYNVNIKTTKGVDNYELVRSISGTLSNISTYDDELAKLIEQYT